MAMSAKEISGRVCEEVGRCMARVESESLERAAAALLSAQRIFVAGAGRSGLAVRALAMRLMHMGKAAYVVGDTTTPAIRAGDLLVIGSGSGRTASLVVAAEKAKSLGVSVLLVTIDAGSPIAELADCVVRVDAPSPKAAKAVGTETSIQPMGALFEQSMFLLFDSLIVAMMKAENTTSDMMFGNHANLE